MEKVRTLTPPNTSIANLPVFSYDQAGHVVEQLVTNTEGEVSLDIPEGGGVGVLELHAGTNGGQLEVYRYISTFEGVPEGSTIAVYAYESARQVEPPPDHYPMTFVKVAVTGLPAGTQSWSAVLSCAGTSSMSPSFSNLNFLDYEGCRGEPTYDAVAYAVDANGAMIAFGHTEGLSFVEGGQATITIPLSNASLLGQFSGSLTNVPSGVYSTSLDVGCSRAEQLGFSLSRNASPATPMLSLVSSLPSTYGDAWYATANVRFDSSGNSGLVRTLSSKTFPPSPFGLDASAHAEIDHVFENFADWTHLPIEWTTQGPDTADATVLSETWTRPGVTTYWTATRPAGAGKMRLPDLPPGYEDWTAKPGDYLHGAWVTQQWDSSNGFPDYLDSLPDYKEYDHVYSYRQVATP